VLVNAICCDGRVGFTPVFLRNATAFGPSPRYALRHRDQRLCALAWTTRRIAMTSDGSPWRPVVHVEDICEAIYRSLIAPEDAVRGKVFNVGKLPRTTACASSRRLLRRSFRLHVSVGSSGETTAVIASTSTVSTRVARLQVPSRGARWRKAAARAVRAHPDAARDLQFRAFTRLKQLKYLQATHQIDGEFYWH